MRWGELYAKMYSVVAGAASDAIDDLEAGQPLRARIRLERALYEAEEFYLECGEGEVIPFSGQKDRKERK